MRKGWLLLEKNYVNFYILNVSIVKLVRTNKFAPLFYFSTSVFRRTGRAGNKGFAYTFITPEQERYTGEIIRALELSESPIPPDLAKMWNDYKERAKAVSGRICYAETYYFCQRKVFEIVLVCAVYNLHYIQGRTIVLPPDS